jgi:transcriptional regulator of acetoin/glycerol metabolism
MSSWESFMEGRESGARQIRDMVNESWRRCLSADVDHRRYRAPSPIAQDDFQVLREHCSDLIDASAPVMASARDFLHETGTVMVLADPAGTVLSLEGDIALEDATQNIHLVPGASWSEFACGTNAIGTAIETGFPIQIHSNEHFCLGIKNWSCSAAVIRDPRDGAILGAIDISGLRKAYSRHSMALVVATAARIESRIAQIEMDFRYRLLDQNMTRLSSSAGESVVIFDRHGRAIKANADIGAVLRDLGAPREEAQAGAPALSFEWDRRSTTPGPLPPWIRPEWLTPIYSGNQRLGAVLTVPGAHARLRQYHWRKSRLARRGRARQPRRRKQRASLAAGGNRRRQGGFRAQLARSVQGRQGAVRRAELRRLVPRSADQRIIRLC